MPAKTIILAVLSGLVVAGFLTSKEILMFYSSLTARVYASDTVKTRVQNIEEEKTSDIPLLTQERNLSCEAAAIRMVLSFFGENISEEEIFSRIPKNQNPYLGFRGNVDGKVWGFKDYGAYAPAVVKALEYFRVPATAYTNISESFLKQKILEGKPAIIWVNTTNPDPKVQYAQISGENVKLVSGEHTVVVTGFNNGRWQINDPWGATENGQRVGKIFEIEDLDQIYWNLFDHMAVIVN